MDLAAFLESRGEKLTRSGRDFRLTRDHSVTIYGNRWYDHASQKGGGPISFVQQFYGLDYPARWDSCWGAVGSFTPLPKNGYRSRGRPSPCRLQTRTPAGCSPIW